MKKLILLIFAFVFAFCASAQSSTGTLVYMKTSLSSTSLSDTGDIQTNATDTVNFYLNTSSMTNGSIEVVTFYSSGTAPICTAFLEFSNNGVTWSQRQTAQKVNGDTLNLTPLSGITSKGILAIPTNCYQYCRVRVYGHKTQSVGVKSFGIIRKDARY